MKIQEVTYIIDRHIKNLNKKVGNFKDSGELQDKITKGRISTLKRLKNDLKTKFALMDTGESHEKTRIKRR